MKWLRNQDTAYSSIRVFRVAEDDGREVGKKKHVSQVTKLFLFLMLECVLK